ncbi:hypothetical protein AB6A40_002182 [Gnathostoma spinigerum]|uniref:Uncharacterized protein n=1 Tax=Gnathostoma spinigerum TaxID=75299 RepID=A0ABD6E5Y3_9BILA
MPIHRAQVASMAEDCGNVLATHVSSQACRKVLIAVIKSDTNIPKIQLAIKMLTKVIESLSAEELLPLLDEVVPPIVNTYNYESSSVRKASVLCLVAINDIVGSAAMEPYYQDLNKGKLKLLEVYIQRKKANNNASLHSSVQF